MRHKLVSQLEGHRFGKLLVLVFAGTNNHHQSAWLCKCDCGNRRTILGRSLRTGNTKSCGCLLAVGSGEGHVKHGHSRRGKHTPEYNSWRAMNKRCSNPNTPGYKNWGGRGIKVCKRWLKFENFLADMGPRPAFTSIERRNNDGDYKPSNCYWATRKEQRANQRN